MGIDHWMQVTYYLLKNRLENLKCKPVDYLIFKKFIKYFPETWFMGNTKNLICKSQCLAIKIVTCGIMHHFTAFTQKIKIGFTKAVIVFKQ